MKKRTLALIMASFMAFTPVIVSAEAAEAVEETAEEAAEETEEAAEETEEAAEDAIPEGDEELIASEMEAAFEAMEIKGDYAEFDSYKLWIPEGMEAVESDSEEDAAYSLILSDEESTLKAGYIEGAFESVEELESALKEAGFETSPIKINGMDGFMYTDKEKDELCVDLFDEGTDVEVCISPASNENVVLAAVMVMGTLQKK